MVIASRTIIQRQLRRDVCAFAALLSPDIEVAFQNCCKLVLGWGIYESACWNWLGSDICLFEPKLTFHVSERTPMVYCWTSDRVMKSWNCVSSQEVIGTNTMDLLWVIIGGTCLSWGCLHTATYRGLLYRKWILPKSLLYHCHHYCLKQACRTWWSWAN